MSAGISEVSPSPRPVAVVRPLRNWARAASISVGVVGAAALCSAVLQLKQAGDYGDLAPGAWEGEDPIRPDRLEWFAFTAPMVLVFAAAIPFIVWFHRARANADVMAPGPHNLGKGLAIGGWFIPLAMAVIPLIVTYDTWKAGAAASSAEAGPSRPPHVLLWGWWLTFWAGFMLSGRMLTTGVYASDVQSGEATAAEFFDAAQRSCVFGVVSGLCTLVSAVLAILVVRRITAMQSDPR
jgi:hypothetical protein